LPFAICHLPFEFFMTHLHLAICPFCGFNNELATMVDGNSKPENGDLSICFQCVRVSVFDDTLVTGVRKPTQSEQIEIALDNNVLNAVRTLQQVKRDNGVKPKGQGR
jgi:hypothetical protein